MQLRGSRKQVVIAMAFIVVVEYVPFAAVFLSRQAAWF
jgi:hypothetical protein